jgi:tRNA ligase
MLLRGWTQYFLLPPPSLSCAPIRDANPISQLCDDSFEEHVLGYPPEKTGLHLHGINESTKTFRTLPQASVDAFAAEWGFIQTASITLDSIAAVESFTSNCAKTGQWNGEAVEGFVVRTHVTKPPRGKGNRKSVEEPPYEAGSSFFFKVKFDEPYMMYRDWRELTKMILSSKGNASLSVRKLPKAKLKRPETQVYVKWVLEEIGRDRGLFEQYTKGKGIIETRERFLQWMETDEGIELLEKAKKGKLSLGYDAGKSFGKTIILPIAVPGCGTLFPYMSVVLPCSCAVPGKTSVAVALAHVFGFAHTQSDDVQAKKAAPKFLKNVTTLLHKNDVVIADKCVPHPILFHPV